jgi:beta-glucosidase
VTDRIESLVQAMTVEEKVSLAAGSGLWHTTAVERLGIPRLKVTDGPIGARGAGMTGAVTSVCFPCGTALAATWNPDLIRRVGETLAEEAQSKGARVLLGPTVNIHRSPLAGRNFECYSEDPYLSARIAVAYIQGVQSRGVAATVKHFVCNDSEFERMTISSAVGARALREIYLPPFEAAVREAGVWAIMTAYNRLNGVYCSENPWLLRDLLEGEWGFDGLVMSDWYGTHSTAAAANAGLDLEMPGPPQYMGGRLLAAVRAGEVPEAVVDDHARRLLRLLERTGALDEPEEQAEQAIDRPEHRTLARDAATEAIVLLKNEGGMLPLDPAGMRRLAVIGPNAARPAIQGGGSAQVTPHYVITPLAALRAALPGVEVIYEPGCSIDRGVPPLDAGLLRAPDGEPGLLVEYFAGSSPAGTPLRTERARRTRLQWLGDLSSELPANGFAARLTGRFTPETSGSYTFSLTSAGRSRLSCDGALIVDNWDEQPSGASFYGAGGPPLTGIADLVAGRAYELRVEFAAPATGRIAGVILGCAAPVPTDLIERAEAAAAGSDAVVVVAGTNADWETEGTDRADMDLPGHQAELIRRVAAKNPRTAVVVNAGSPVMMDWADAVPAVLCAWFGGQEAGNAVADVLLGAADPGGRLPTTIPMRLEDTPAFITYPGEHGEVLYGEGVFAGYRYYDRKQVEPRYPFGHGLSYTTFAYSDLMATRAGPGPDDPIEVSARITNTGRRPGHEVVQLYVGPAEGRPAQPDRELKGFAKLRLAPGQSQVVRFTLNRRAWSHWSPSEQAWVAERGAIELTIGATSRDQRLCTTVTLDGEGAARAAGNGG